LPMWLLLVTVGILSTFGPSPGPIERIIYRFFPSGSREWACPRCWPNRCCCRSFSATG
jgi:hypothetical protein